MEEFDGYIKGWTVSVFLEHYPQQGYDLHVAPYEVDGKSAPDEVYEVCHALSDGEYEKKVDAMKALKMNGFVKEKN